MKIVIHQGAGGRGGSVELAAAGGRLLLDYGAELDLPGLREKSSPPLFALLISNSQPSRCAGLLAGDLRPGLQVYMSEAMEETARLPAKLSGGAQLPKGILHYSRNKKFTVGPFAVTPYLMDSSAAEAYAFLVEAEGKRVLYTGDFRGHGGKVFKQFLALKTGPVDALIADGAGAELEKGPDEQEVLDHVEPLVKGRRGAVFFMCAAQDAALLARLALLARNTKRFLAVDGYTALLLERLKALAQKQGVELKLPGLETEYLRVIRNSATQRIYTLSEYKDVFARMRDKLYGWDWVRANLPRLVIPVRANAQLWVEEQLPDLSGASFIYSGWDAYAEEPGLAETLAWFRARGLDETEVPLTGHAYFSAVRKLDEEKKPRYIIPINAAQPEKFADTFGKRARLLAPGEEFTL